MSTRLIPALALVLAVPFVASAQVAPTVAPAPVAANADVVQSVPALAPVPVTADVASVPALAPVAVAQPTPVVALVQEAPRPAVPARPAQAAQPAQPAQPAAPEAARPRQATQAEREADERLVQAQRRRHLEEGLERQSKGVNVRIEATVIESKGEQVTGRKTLTLTLVDGEEGSVRSSQVVFTKNAMGMRAVPSPLNMDAKAFMRADGRVKVALTLEYRSVPGSQDRTAGSQSVSEGAFGDGALDEGIKQTVTVVLESGKPLVVAQSADAVGDRRVALEVKATVLK